MQNQTDRSSPRDHLNQAQTYLRSRPDAAISAMPEPVQPGIRGIVDGMKQVGAGQLATQVAYTVLFALPPVFILTVAIGALLEEYGGIEVASRMQDLIREYAPAESQQLLLDLVDQALLRISPGLASVSALVFLLIALSGSMSGMSALTQATNRAYSVRETRSFMALRGRILLLAILIPLLTILAIVLIFFGNAFGDWVADETGFQFLTHDVTQLAVAFSMLLFGFLLTYQIAPNVDHAFIWSMPGALTASAALLVAMAVFQLVLEHFAVANIYGAASSVIILLYLFRILGYVYILGAVMNSVLSGHHDEVRQADLSAHPEKQIFTADGIEIAF